MRTMLRVTLDVEAANKAIRDNTLGQVMQSQMQKLKPEASYFFADHGKRTAYIVFDLNDPSDIPVIAEPFFLNFNATVEFMPVMNADDLRRGLERVAG